MTSNLLKRSALTLFVALMTTANVFALNGNGTPEDPYQISSYYDLRDFGYILIGYNCTPNPSACAIQTGDFEMNAYSHVPFGLKDDGSVVPFTGTYDGNGHYIRNLKYDGDALFCGIFCHISGGTVKNLTLYYPSLKTTQNNACCSAIAAKMSNGATIENCVVCNSSIIASGDNSVSGVFVGTYEGSDNLVKDCYYYNSSECPIAGTTGEGLTITNASRIFKVYLPYYVTTTATVVFVDYVGNDYYLSGITFELFSDGYILDYYLNGAYLDGNSFTLDRDISVSVNNIVIDPAHYSVEGDTCTIHSDAGWNVFCNQVQHSSNTYEGKFVKLDSDVHTTRMADGKFQGTFDGNRHTLNVNYNFSTANEFCAPFPTIYKGCTIQNLRVTGTITSSVGRASGLVGYASGTGTVIITNCRISTTIICTMNHNGDANCNGLICKTWGSNASITGTVFDGKLLRNSEADGYGGFVGYRLDDDVLDITNCLYAPATIESNETEATNNARTFCFSDDGSFTLTNSYYMRPLGTAQGKQAHSIMPGAYTTVRNFGSATVYDVSGITSYGSSLLFNNLIYSGNQETVELNISANIPSDFIFSGFVASAGTLSGSGNPYTLAMPDEDVTIDARTMPSNLTVANGTESSFSVPIEGYNANQDQRNHILYPAADLTDIVGKPITQLTFYIDTTAANGSNTDPTRLGIWTVSIGITDRTDVGDNYTYYSLTKVFEDYLDCSSGKTMTIPFDHEYVYQGQNIILELYRDGKAGEYNTWYFLGVTAPGASFTYDYPRNFLPKTTFLYYSCESPTNLSCRDVTNHTTTLDWNSGADTWQICLNDDEDHLINVTEKPYTLTNLVDDSLYTAKVRTLCGDENDFSQWSNEVSFTTLPNCIKPENLAVSNVTNHKATLDWTSDADAWQICLNGDEDHLIAVTGHPYTLTGLVDDSLYTVKLRSNCGGENGDSKWTDEVSFTTFPNCFVPTKLGASRVLPQSAVLEWTGIHDSYNVRYKSSPQANPLFFDDLYDGNVKGWSFVNLEEGGGFGWGGFCFKYTTNPPQYLISPEMNLTESGLYLHFYYSAESSRYPESFKVGFSSTGKAVEDFTWGEEVTTDSQSWMEYVTEYPEGTKYFAIQCTSDDKYYLDIDDVGVYEPIPGGDWVYLNEKTSPLNISKLTTDTPYLWQVQGISNECEGGVTQWSDRGSFVTRQDNFFIHEGNWNEGSNWYSGNVPANGARAVLFANAVIPDGCTVNASNIILARDATLTIEDGGQLICCEHEIEVTVEKNISKYNHTGLDGSDPDGWHFIALPIQEWNGVFPRQVINLTENEYDLYRLRGNVWQNYKSEENNFTKLYEGEGYLYANSEDVTLKFHGWTELFYEGINYWINAGWQLIGNPYSFDIYIDKEYYRMNTEGTAIEAVESFANNPIPHSTGFLVYSENVEDWISFYSSPTTTSSDQGKLNIALAQVSNARGASRSSATLIDNAIVSFNEGSSLPKFTLFEGNAKLYIPQNGTDYAIACAEKQGELPLNFMAVENGTYTISVNPEGVEMAYLHLIDNLTGADVDLLTPEPVEGPASYTFQAQTTDYASRFSLVFSTIDGASTSSATFAFISNGNIIIPNASKDATLQIVDMMGHVILFRDAVRHVSTNGMTAGVYVLRLIDGNDIKTQKIVIQ